ncbi:hypothetical protein ZIOFF_013515 [Zingiber officinale]|uniref:Uncharacterized protein n=1 Tax=Zingiber officinale TaxID=94328 RepID=A0A8J5LNW7_ZINOF|nr:hypothetical protein ZIOFF_013515 [Zingiber officinale]
MASLDPVDRRARGQLRRAGLSRIGASKAQAALAKIIAIITDAPPGPSPDAIRCSGGDQELKGGGTPPPAEQTGRVDLRLRLGLPAEIAGGSAEGNRRATGGPVEWVCALAASGKIASEAGRSFSPAVSAAPCGGGDALTGSRSSEGECDPLEIENGKESHEEIAAAAATAVFNSSSTTSSRARSRAGYLDLLLEAVRQVSGVAFDDDAPAADKRKPEAATAVDEGGQRPPTPPGAKRTKEAAEHWAAQLDVYEEADTAPIVRSKRGRSQALPSRFRDSILDPWRKPPAVTRHGRAARP